MRKASLFSGIGGIDLAAHWAGMETVVFCERESFPQKVLRKHWPDVPIIDDVHDFTAGRLEELGIGTIDLISIGDPCQPYSVAGNRTGEKDDRFLWPQARRVVEEIRPRWVVRENVPGNISMGLDGVLTEMEDLDYTCWPIVFPAAGVGASHKRERVFVVGYAESSGCRWESWRRTNEKSSDRCSNVADASSERCRKARKHSGRSKEWVAECCENVADSSRKLPYGHWGKGERGTESPDGGRDVADTDRAGREERDAAAFTDRSGHHSWRSDAGRPDGAAQPCMGRVLDELSAWMDGCGINPLDALQEIIANYPQPAPMGMAQYEWEPPRVAKGIKNRTGRLKALGNAVDPLQIYPIMQAIKWIDEAMS